MLALCYNFEKSLPLNRWEHGPPGPAAWGLVLRLGGASETGVPHCPSSRRQAPGGSRGSIVPVVCYLYLDLAARNDGHPAVIWADEMPRTPVVITINKT